MKAGFPSGNAFSSLVGSMFRSFQTKVLMLVLCGVLVPSAVLWLFTVRDTEQFQTRQTLETFSTTLNVARRDVNYWYKDRVQELERLIHSNAFRKPFEDYFLATDPEAKTNFENEVRTYFQIVREKFPMYEEFVVLDPDGGIAIASDEIGEEKATRLKAFHKDVHGQVRITDTFTNLAGDRVFQWVLVPNELTTGDRVTVCVRVGLEGMSALLAHGESGVGSLYLVDSAGFLLTQPPYAPPETDGSGKVNLLGQKALDIVGPPTTSDTPVVHKFTRDMLTQDGHRYRKQTFLTSRLYLSERRWWLVCEAEEGEFVAPMVTRKKRLLLANALICVFFVLVAVKMSHNLLKPLADLRLGARRINEGMVGVKIPRTSRDEIGEAIGAFNEMAQRIALTETELQAKAKQLATQNGKLQNLNEQLKKLSMTDGLTGLFNHRHFWNLLNSELTRVNLYQGELGLILLDIDNFKRVNDQFGHSAGDRLISMIATVLKETVRETDIVSRYGGEEFAILLPDTSKEGVLVASEKIRSAVQKMVFKVPDTDITLSVTVSIGVSVFRGSRREFFNAADRALYCSKDEGKNRVSFAVAES